MKKLLTQLKEISRKQKARSCLFWIISLRRSRTRKSEEVKLYLRKRVPADSRPVDVDFRGLFFNPLNTDSTLNFPFDFSERFKLCTTASRFLYSFITNSSQTCRRFILELRARGRRFRSERDDELNYGSFHGSLNETVILFN